jgi:hypothetical protein
MHQWLFDVARLHAAEVLSVLVDALLLLVVARIRRKQRRAGVVLRDLVEHQPLVPPASRQFVSSSHTKLLEPSPAPLEAERSQSKPRTRRVSDAGENPNRSTD